MKVFISNKEIEEIASGLIHVACGHQESGQIDIDSIARFLGLSVLYEQIMEEDMDKIGFLSNGSYPLYVNRQINGLGLSFQRIRLYWILFCSVPQRTAAGGLSLPMKLAMS